MSERARPKLAVVYERSFVLEDAADEFYEQAMERYTAPFEVDRFDAHRVRVYLDGEALDRHAEEIEARFDPLTHETRCICGHLLVQHDEEQDYCCILADCDCEEFQRGD